MGLDNGKMTVKILCAVDLLTMRVCSCDDTGCFCLIHLAFLFLFNNVSAIKKAKARDI